VGVRLREGCQGVELTAGGRRVWADREHCVKENCGNGASYVKGNRVSETGGEGCRGLGDEECHPVGNIGCCLTVVGYKHNFDCNTQRKTLTL
jgi:hypothetical protein